MRSSISSSSERAQKYQAGWRWHRVWLIVVAMYLILLAGWETAWRLYGFVPSVTDDWPIWSEIRRQANMSEDAIALVGASRILLGLDPVVLEQELASSVHMLAIDGSNPLPVLYDLAGDSDFTGDVICSISPLWLAAKLDSSADRAAVWLKKFHKQSLASRMEAKLSLLLQTHLVFRYGGLAPRKLWEKWLLSKPIVPPYAPMRADRYRPADYAKVDLAALQATRVKRTRELHEQATYLGPKEFRRRIAGIREAVESLKKRGGTVVFLRLPSCGEVWDIEEKSVPRYRYWDVFAREVQAPALHFHDYPQLQDFSCTDGSHLNHDDALKFTRAVSRIINDRSLLER